MTWMIVNFIQENSVEVVPKSWVVDGKECFWPPYKRNKLFDAIRNKLSPGCEWKVFKIKILGQYDDFEIAQKKCKKAQDDDNLMSSNSESFHHPMMGKGYRRRKPKSFDNYELTDSSDDSYHDDIAYPQQPRCMKSKQIDSGNDTALNDNVGAENILSCIPESNLNNETDVVVISKQMDKLQIDFNNFYLENKEFQRQVLRQLIILNTRVKEVTENIEVLLKLNQEKIENRIVSSEHCEEEAIQVAEKMKIFPIQNEADLNKIESILKNEKEFGLLAKELSLVGGDSVKDVTKRILYQLLNNEMGALYSWEGAKGKKKFKELLLSKLIIKAVRSNKSTKEATEAEIIKYSKEWLVRAKFRAIAKKERLTEGVTQAEEESQV